MLVTLARALKYQHGERIQHPMSTLSLSHIFTPLELCVMKAIAKSPVRDTEYRGLYHTIMQRSGNTVLCGVLSRVKSLSDMDEATAMLFSEEWQEAMARRDRRMCGETERCIVTMDGPVFNSMMRLGRCA